MNRTNAILWLGALLLGALVPACIVAGLSQRIELLPAALAVTLAHAVVLGLPAALLFRDKHWMRAGPVLVGGFLVGAITEARNLCVPQLQAAVL
jgi:hypothetical protein